MCAAFGQYVNYPMSALFNTHARINHRQNVLFEFGKLLTSIFSVDLSTKLHRLMRHIKNHIVNRGCINGVVQKRIIIISPSKAFFFFSWLLNYNHTQIEGSPLLHRQYKKIKYFCLLLLPSNKTLHLSRQIISFIIHPENQYFLADSCPFL